MKLEQSFTVAAPIEVVWDALVDVERVAPCLPGAQITGHGPDGSYEGNFTVKLGPKGKVVAGGGISAAPAGGTLTFSLDTKPAGMAINASSGVIAW